ncbi:galactokinase [Lentilactobacillus fungorum]|uniref:Galactokinase n=1 Tax=Lentilactobacillus fungorum TaxID=2201250 RepID=A0ABQ3W1Y9_9LACO|nr:galactokinase [Lentilactobacillus fungorum]GHP15205.1 galactokinase [Lentilactobacillus fungorum]
MIAEEVQTKFKQKFGYDASRVFFSPGRINLIGEYTDFNGGHVFPCAISMGIYAAYGKRDDNRVRMYSANVADQGIVEFSLDDLAYDKAAGWANYPKGMMLEIMNQGHQFSHGFDLAVYGNLPDAAGLSSSAAIELLTGEIVNDVFSLNINELDLVKYGQLVENNYIGVNSGIMDQFAIGMGKKEQAVLLDTNNLKYEYVPVKLGDNVIVIMNTKKHRELQDSKYNERRAQCEEALRRLQTKLDINSLGDLTETEFDEHTYLINDDVLIRRARHAVFENQRTLQAKKALVNNDLNQFGHLINASHVSLHYDFEVTGKELDTLAETAWKQPGVIGARMTGAGFGGCAIAIVDRHQVDAFKQNVGQAYEQVVGHPAEFYIAEISDGPREIK